MTIILTIIMLMILIGIAAMRWGKDSTDAREGFDWEQQQHGQDKFSSMHHAFSSF